MQNVIFTDINILYGRRGGFLLYYFTGHHTEIVKKFTQSNKNEENKYNIRQVQIMAGGITPVSQPIDYFIGKSFKGFYR